MIEVILDKHSILLLLSGKVYGTVKRIGMLNNEPILYGDINVVKPGSLYYIPGVKLVYRYIKPIFRKAQNSGQSTPIGGVQIGGGGLPGGHPLLPTVTEEYHFTTIEQTSTDSLMIPEEERGTIRNAGYLFNEIIYSGDPNLVSNGSLFYHSTLPYISVISNVDGIINLSTKEVNSEGEVTTVVTKYKVSPTKPYAQRYLTFKALEDGTFSFKITAEEQSTPGFITEIQYSLDNGNTWVRTEIDSTLSGTIVTTPLIKRDKTVLWKGNGSTSSGTGSTCYCYFETSNKYDVYGNVMSLVLGDRFNDWEQILPEHGGFENLFSGTLVVSAENLIISLQNLTIGCCENMFGRCAFLTTAPVLPARVLSSLCYRHMFYGCTSLSYIKMLATDISAYNCLQDWVDSVASTGTFVKNANATIPFGADGIPEGWTVETVEVDPTSDEITI